MTHCGKFVGLGYWVLLGMLAQATIGCGGRASDSAAGSGNASGAPSSSGAPSAGGGADSGGADSGGADGAGAAAALPPPAGPFAVSQYFAPDLLGDGATPGKISVDINDHCKVRPDGARGACYRFVYTFGDVAWGGAQWLIGGSNWGQQPGLPITAASLHRVSFYAAEDGGTDIVNFVIGGVNGAAGVPPGTYTDTFERQVSETLSADWQKFEIDIPQPSDFQPPITSLLGAFTWAVKLDCGCRSKNRSAEDDLHR